MALDRNDVKNIAFLARLKVPEDDLDHLAREISGIIGWVEQLNEVDTEGVEPMAHAQELANVFRRDEVRPSLPPEAALANAPNRDDECYRVPAVLGDV